MRSGSQVLVTITILPAAAAVGTEELPERFEWFYVYDISSAEVPVTDSLVVVMRTPSGNFAARVAARM